MADGGQRLLDVIDDPNALESFLGGLTSASDLLPSGESVDTVVASLAGSFHGDYDVGSPNENLFDSLESSNTLTDISQSYVGSEFDNGFHELGNGPVDGNGDAINMDALVKSTLEQHNFGTGVCDAITSGTVSEPIQQTASSYVHQTTTTTTTITHQEQHQQQQLLVHNQIKVEQDVGGNSRTYTESFSQLVGVQEGEEHQTEGLSHNNNNNASLSNIGSNNVSNSDNVSSINNSNSISSSQGSSSSCTSGSNSNVNGPLSSAGAEEASVGLVDDKLGGSLVGGANSSNLISANVVNVPNNASGSGSGAVASLSLETVKTVALTGNQVNTSLSLVQQQQHQGKSLVATSSAGIQLQQAGQEQQQRYIISNPLLQQAQVNVGGQLISSSIAGGQSGSNLVQFSTANSTGQQQFFTLDGSQTPTFITANGSAFGAANVALLNAGGTPTYTVLPASSGIFSNTIQVQQGIQALKTASGQTFFQTPSGSIVAANNLAGLSNVQGVTIPTSPVNRGKQQPQQILPKPAGEAVQPPPSPSPGQIVLQQHQQIHTSTAYQTSTNSGGHVSQLQTSVGGQLIQQAQHNTVVSHMVQPTNTTVIPANSGLNFSTQPTFTIGGANGVGQVVLSTGATLGATQQQLGGTFVLNQFGQPMLLPSAGGTGTNGVQYIVRQQPSHAQQMFTIQTTSGAAGQKPVVRLVPQISQNTVQIQQIQTPNGPAYIAVRCPAPQTQATHQQFVHAAQQPQGDVKPQIQVQTQQIKIETGVRQTGVAQMQGNTVVRPVVVSNGMVQPQPSAPSVTARPQITIKAEKVLLDQVSNQSFGNPSSVSSMPSPASSGPPTPIEVTPKKSKSKKKKVMLDLDEILNMSGIGDEDLQDDSCFENDVPDTPSFFMNEGSSSSFNQSSGPSTPLQQGTAGSPSTKPNGALKTTAVPFHSPHVHVLQPTTQAPKTKKSKGGGAGSSSGSKSTNNTAISVPSAPTIPKSSPKKGSPAKRKSNADPEVEPPSKKGSPANNKKRINNSVTNNNNTIKTNNNNIASPPVTPASKKKRPPAKSPVVKTEVVSSPKAPTSGSFPGSSASATPQAIRQTSPATIPQSTPQRIVQTIQLTPQNQQLLRNIQVQIQRLLGIPKRNENEQTALQKLVYLQQQVIATGVPVPNPSHLSTGSGSGTQPSTQVPASAVVGGVLQQAATISNTTTIKLTTSSLNAAKGSHVNVGPKTYLTPVLPKTINSLQNVALNNNQKTDVAYASPADTVLTKGGPPLGPTVVVIEDAKAAEQRRAQAKAEEEARARWKKEQFEFLLKRDQEFYVKPDCETPFTSVEDAVERLMKYHIVKDRTEMNFEDFDDEFSDTAVRLLDKFNNMVHKYKGLMLKESMKEVSLAEQVMVERKFCSEEKLRLEQDKLLVAQGEILDLPPPPDDWVPQLREMVEEDLREFELDTSVSVQVQSAIDSITSFDEDESLMFDVDGPKAEYDEFGNLLSGISGGYPNDAPSSSADIDEAVRSILF